MSFERLVMKFDLSFDIEQNRFTLKTYGYLSMDGIKEMIKTLVTHDKWEKGRDLFIDHREASFEKISQENMLVLSQTVISLDKTLGAHRCAVVSPDNGYAKHAMYEYTVETKADLITRTFLADQYDQAIEWLDSQM